MNQYCAAVVKESLISLSLATASDGHVAESLLLLKVAVGCRREVDGDVLIVIGIKCSRRDP